MPPIGVEPYYQWQGKTLVLKFFVQPNAGRNEFVGRHGECIKVVLSSLPVKGQANQQLVDFLSKIFAVKKSQITILKGLRPRYKVVKVCTPSQLPPEFLK